mgnify:FL=1
MNQAVWRERLVLYALLTSLTALSIDALLPALRLIEAELPPTAMLDPHHVVSLFIFGMVFGELCLGPISDAMGRKPALVGGLVLYGCGTLICLWAGSLEWLILGRILQGAGVSGPKIATRAMIRDQYQGDAMARVMSFLFTLFILVPMVAPAVGQWIAGSFGWRMIFGGYLVTALLLGGWLALRHPETLTPERRVPLSVRRLGRNAFRILGCARVSLLIVATGLVFGAQLTFLSLAADVFADVYGITHGFPYLFAGLAAGIGLASFLNGRLVQRFGSDAMARAGFIGLSLSGATMTSAALFSQGHPPLWLFLSAGFAAFFAIGILFGNLNAMAMLDLGQVAGLGASLIASLSSLVATGVALAASAFYAGTVTPMGSAILFAGAAALLLSELAARRPRRAPVPTP